MFKIYVRIWSNAKGVKCRALCLDFGYRLVYLSFDSSIVAEFLNVSVAELYSYDFGNYGTCSVGGV